MVISHLKARIISSAKKDLVSSEALNQNVVFVISNEHKFLLVLKAIRFRFSSFEIVETKATLPHYQNLKNHLIFQESDETY